MTEHLVPMLLIAAAIGWLAHKPVRLMRDAWQFRNLAPGDGPVTGFVEILSGIVRVGPQATTYGEPFDFAVAFSSIDGKATTAKALVNPNQTILTRAHVAATISVLKAAGFQDVTWERFKQPLKDTGYGESQEAAGRNPRAG